MTWTSVVPRNSLSLSVLFTKVECYSPSPGMFVVHKSITVTVPVYICSSQKCTVSVWFVHESVTDPVSEMLFTRVLQSQHTFLLHMNIQLLSVLFTRVLLLQSRHTFLLHMNIQLLSVLLTRVLWTPSQNGCCSQECYSYSTCLLLMKVLHTQSQNVHCWQECYSPSMTVVHKSVCECPRVFVVCESVTVPVFSFNRSIAVPVHLVVHKNVTVPCCSPSVFVIRKSEKVLSIFCTNATSQCVCCLVHKSVTVWYICHSQEF